MAGQLETYWALVAKPGTFLADGGVINITPQRTERWYQQFNAFKRDGFAIPTPWGHKLNLAGLPHDSSDPYALDTALVQNNAGYVEALARKPNGELWMCSHVPPGYRYDKRRKALVNERDSTVVKEVSPGFGDFVDGYGRQHRDVLFHVALCTHPVMPGQPGFEAGDALPARAGQRKFMSSAGRITRLQFLGGKPMPGDADDPLKKKPKEGEGGGPDLENILGGGDTTGGGTGGDATISPIEPAGETGDLPADPASTPIEPVVPEPDPAGLNEGGACVSPTQAEQFKQILAQLGSPLLPDTSPKNLIERLLIVLHAAANQGASLSPQPAGGGPSPIDMSTEGAVPDQNASGGGMGGLGTASFMHAKTGKVVHLDQNARVLATSAADIERRRLTAEWDAIAKVGPATIKALVSEEKAKLGRYMLSFSPETGQVALRGARERLGDVKKWLVGSGLFKFTRKLSTAATVKNPAAGVKPLQPINGGQQASDEEIRAEVARINGCKPEQVRITRGVPA